MRHKKKNDDNMHGEQRKHSDRDYSLNEIDLMSDNSFSGTNSSD